MEKVVRKLSFQEAEKEDEKFWLNKTPQEKLEALTRLRVTYHGGQRLKKIIHRVPYDRRA
jgi:hypothetical protein